MIKKLKTDTLGSIHRLSNTRILSFRKIVYKHFAEFGRELPWRKTKDPYHILISEVMLQQTQVDRVIGKYTAFIKTFPDFKTLAKASLEQVYAVWQGLGYNRRALSLKKMAEIVIEKHKGKLPATEEELTALPGIGKATAASIAAFGFNKPSLFIETNIRTVFIHHFFKNRDAVDDPEILGFLTQTLDKTNPRKWYSALMDYGTMLKKKHRNPSRKSAHYVKQSRFEGSRRQARGAILKTLLNAAPLTENGIAQKLSDSNKIDIKEILDEMCNEGLLRKIKGVRGDVIFGFPQ
jgi:A/G-specific adenine glycosylase